MCGGRHADTDCGPYISQWPRIGESAGEGLVDMATWVFRLRGQFSGTPVYEHVFKRGARVSAGKLPDGRSVLRFSEPSRTDFAGEFTTEGTFGYLTQPDGSLRVWLRQANSGGEVSQKLVVNVVRPGLIDGVQTVDLLQREQDSEPLGRLVAEWVVSWVQE